MLSLFAHRGNLYGPDAQAENTQTLIAKALELGFGVETDIRQDRLGAFYISHDCTVASSENDAISHAELWKRNPRSQIALNIKELGYTIELVDFVDRHQLRSQIFLFDFELLENKPGSTAAEIHVLDPKIRLAARVSDRYGETIEQAASITVASIIWLDEFDSLWVTANDIAKLKSLGRTIYAISPEIHGFSMAETETRWKQFQDWGVDGICTDYPVRAREVLGSWQSSVSS